jgi:hypothetical protein
MAERVPFLNTQPTMPITTERPAEDEELTRVGPERHAASTCGAFGTDHPLSRNCATCRGVCASWARISWRFVTGAARWAFWSSIAPSRHLARVWADLRERDTVLLSRVAVRRRRHDPRNAGRAGRQHAEGTPVSRRLSGARVSRAGVRLYGAA